MALARSAAETFEKIGLHYEHAKATTFAGIALTQDEQLEQALGVFTTARNIFVRERNDYWAASIDLFRAHALLAAKRALEARVLAAGARRIFEKLNAPSRVATALALMARAELSMNRLEDARHYARDISTLIERDKIPLHLFLSYSVCGQVEEQSGNAARAMEYYALAAQDVEIHRTHIDRDELRVAFSNDKQQVYESLVRLSLDHNSDAGGAFEWCERAKSRALIDMLANHAGVVTPEALQQSLPEGHALIEYFIAQGEVLAFSISEGRLRVHRDLCTLQELESTREWLHFQMERFMPNLPDAGADEAKLLETTNFHLHHLYQHLIAPVVKGLEADHVVIVPHGIMHDLPFHAFYDGRHYLMDRFTVSYAPSSSVFHYCAGKTVVDGRPLIMGVADNDAPFIKEEIAELQRIAPGAVTLFGPEATTEAFRREAVSSSFVHIATHSIFRRDNPMSSAFRLADGWLSALDMYSIRCEANLVTLSGCSSGVSRVAGTDELLGLRRGLLYAGARSLLVSLWNLNDETASAFMKVFYREWLQGNSKVQALRTAANEVRKLRPHPFFWAPFCLVGKP